MDDAQDGATVVQQGDERTEQEAAADEVLGAIDRVQRPHVLGVRMVASPFLADDAMRWELLRDELAHHLLGFPIRYGDRACIGLMLDAELGAEVTLDYLRASLGQRLGKGDQCPHCS